MEDLYQKFTKEALPRIQEGIFITKEYFVELYARYIKYLIVTDLFISFVLLSSIILFLLIIKKYFKDNKKERGFFYENDDIGVFIFAISVISIIVITIFFIDRLILVYQDIYVPEIRIMELLFK